MLRSGAPGPLGITWDASWWLWTPLTSDIPGSQAHGTAHPPRTLGPAELQKERALASLIRFMNLGPRRQGLCRWHCRELTASWAARWAATATTCTASYISAAAACGRHTARAQSPARLPSRAGPELGGGEGCWRGSRGGRVSVLSSRRWGGAPRTRGGEAAQTPRPHSLARQEPGSSGGEGSEVGPR